jgi:hypothetical protein
MTDLGEFGSGGSAQKTTEGYENAIIQFSKFVDNCRDVNTGYGLEKSFSYFQDAKTSEMANEQVFRQFAYYLGKEAVKKVTKGGEPFKETQDGEPLAISTALQYFSNFTNTLLQKFRDAHTFFDQFKNLKKGDSIPWVKKIRDDLRSRMEKDLILASIAICLKAKGVSREIMINDYLHSVMNSSLSS